MKNIVFITLAALFVLTGCSTKNLYKPLKEVKTSKKYDGSFDSKIIRINSEAAIFEDTKILLRDNRQLQLENGSFVSVSGEYTITNSNNMIVLQKQDEKIAIPSKSKILSASIEGDYLAVVSEQNSFKIYDTTTQEMVFFSQGGKALAIDNRVAKPYFYSGLVFFPTLDGKVKIVQLDTKKEIRDIVVDTAKEFANIIYLSVVDNTMVIASRNILKTLHNENINTKKATIKEVIVDESSIYLIGKNGQISKLDLSLLEQKSVKFKFARFVAVGFKEKIYLVEKQGYFIELDKELESSSVSKLPDAVEEKSFVSEDKIIIGSHYIQY